MATAAEVRRLTEEYRSRQVSTAAKVSALVAAYYARQVVLDDESSIERWLDIMVPRILRARDDTTALALAYAAADRRLEVPSAIPHDFAAVPGSNAEQIRRSLQVVGPVAHQAKLAEIKARRTPATPEGRRAEVTVKRALEKKAAQDTITKVTGSALRHAQSGARKTLQRAGEDDRVALGYVRVTRDNPCFFCAMLASRGRVYGEGSFSASDARLSQGVVDPRLIGGDAKVHDSCRCTLKPVYDDNDPYLLRADEFDAMWREWGVNGEDRSIVNFRRGYRGRPDLIK